MQGKGEAEDADLQQAADEAAAELPGQVAAAVDSIRAQAAKALGGIAPDLPDPAGGQPA